MESIVANYKIVGIINWNGNGISGLVSREVASRNKYNIPILFAEIGNFKGKVFFDKLGTNASSSIAKNPDILLNYSYNQRDYNQWKEKFVQSRLKLPVIPQAKRKSRLNVIKAIIFKIIDELGYIFHLTPRNKRNIFYEIVSCIRVRIWKFKLKKLETQNLPNKFAFLPLQVSQDSNLICNSNINNFQAIKEVRRKIYYKQLTLIIKLHPAENNPIFLKQIYYFLIQNPQIILTNINAFLLAKKSTQCFTINSTLGLEAKIYGVKVNTLSNTLYSKWENKHIPHYINGFLLSMPYFDKTKPISRNSVQQLLERLFI